MKRNCYTGFWLCLFNVPTHFYGQIYTLIKLKRKEETSRFLPVIQLEYHIDSRNLFLNILFGLLY